MGSQMKICNVKQDGTIMGCVCDNKVNDDVSGKLQAQNAYEGVSGNDTRSFLPKQNDGGATKLAAMDSCFSLIRLEELVSLPLTP